MSLLHFFQKDGKEELQRIRIFHDEERKIIGFKPDKEGYKITTSNNCARIKCASLAKIVTGEFYPKWSKKDKMLTATFK